MKKLLALAIILLFIGMSVIPSTGTTVVKKSTMPMFYDGNTLYVGGSGPNNYTKIQDAIDNASDGDTVFVYDDSSPYNEFVWINKSIDLIGENKNTTVIDGWGTGYRVVVYITADNVTITGFTIYNCSEIAEKGILISKAANVVISENIITNNWIDIDDGITADVIIEDNIITNTTFGIRAAGTSTLIRRNTITNHTFGIHMEYSSNIVEGNIISTSKTVVTPDNVTNTWGIYQRASSNSIIKENTITNHLWGIQCSDSSNHIIYGNIITNNYLGISLSNCSNFEINGNRIINTSWYGVWLKDSSNNNNILRNSIVNSSEYGVYFYYSFFNVVKENNFIKNNRSAFFENSLVNRWVRNYWERPRLLPYPIFGKMKLGNITFPWMNFDWHPAQEPYDIGGSIE